MLKSYLYQKTVFKSNLLEKVFDLIINFEIIEGILSVCIMMAIDNAHQKIYSGE